MTDTNSYPSWLENAIFYEIYPQSFFDSNADGIGDINGIRQKLGYLQSLGVNAIWVNPCFESPFQDAGYDVSDYYKVAPRYGTNADLHALFDEARKSGFHILLDLVPGHTSIEHPWFKASCQHTPNEYSDWYIWTNSAFAWGLQDFRVVSGYAERDGSYLTNFFYFQPALNYGFANPDPRFPWQQPVDAPGPRRVRQELMNIMRFWLDMGADGFRVDMAASLVKGDLGHRETIRLWQEVRAWLDRDYPQACLVSEWSRPLESIPAGFHLDFLLHFGSPGYTSLLRKSFGRRQGQDPYGFSFFDARGHGNIREFLDEYLPYYEKTRGMGHMALVSGNHDINPRVSQDRTAKDLELVFLFLMTMPGVPFIYYGDEIGMQTIEDLPSKEGAYRRTGVRTPMQWDEGPNAGFSMAPREALYLPVDDRPDRPTVAAQETDPLSLLNQVRRLIALRKAHPALCASGDFSVVYAEGGKYPFVYRRKLGEENLLVAINPAGYPVEAALPGDLLTELPETLYGQEGVFHHEKQGWVLRTPGVSGGVYRI
jgi:glycosidase